MGWKTKFYLMNFLDNIGYTLKWFGHSFTDWCVADPTDTTPIHIYVYGRYGKSKALAESVDDKTAGDLWTRWLVCASIRRITLEEDGWHVLLHFNERDYSEDNMNYILDLIVNKLRKEH